MKTKLSYVLIFILSFFLFSKYILAWESPAEKSIREFAEENHKTIENYYYMSCDELEEYIKQEFEKDGGGTKTAKYAVLFGVLNTRLIKQQCE